MSWYIILFQTKNIWVKHMEIIDRNQLRELMEATGDKCISMFMPVHRDKPQTRQNNIRLKDEIQDVERRLEAGGMRPARAREFIEPVKKLLENNIFWQNQGDGFALFLSPETFRYYMLPLPFKEITVVADRFHIKPLLPLFSGGGRFYLLALSQNKVRFFLGTHYNLHEIEIKNVPHNLEEAMKLDVDQRQLQFHTAHNAPAGRGEIVYHGQGFGYDDQKDHMLEDYFRLIDKGLHPLLNNEHVPLLVAGVEYLVPVYRKANTYPNLIGQVSEGNPDILSVKELHNHAWAVMGPLFQKSQEKDMARYRELTGVKRTSNKLEEVISESDRGRVETLFVALDIERWGAYDSDTHEAALHRERQPYDRDLLDLAAVNTLFHRGDVYPVNSEIIPGHAPLAAIFRY